MPPQTAITSFVIRFIQETTDATPGFPQADWHGVIKHVQTNTEQHFTRLEDAIRFMASYVNLEELPKSESPETRISETLPNLKPRTTNTEHQTRS